MKKLIKKNNLWQISLKKYNDLTKYIDWENIAVDAVDENNVVLLSREEIISLIEALKDSRFTSKYIFEYEDSDGFNFSGPIPTAQELTTLYTSNTGLVVEDLQGNQVTLKPTGATALTEGDGITTIHLNSGIFELAGYQAGKILIDHSKNQLPYQLSNLQGGITTNKNAIADNKSEINRVKSRATTLEDKQVITNAGDVILKDMAGKLVQDDKYTSEQATQDSKISALESDNTTNKAAISTATQKNTTQQTQIDDALSRVATLEGIAAQGGPTSPVLDTITDLWTNPQKFEKYKDDILKITASNGSIAFITYFNATNNYRYAAAPTESTSAAVYIDNTQPDKININHSFVDVSRVEIVRVLPVANLASKVEVTNAATKATQALAKATANESALTTANNIIGTKQNSVDNSLTTASKSVVGGINELKAYADSINLNTQSIDTQLDNIKGSISSAGGNKRDVDEFDGSTPDKTLASEYFVENSHVAKKLLGLRKQSDLYNAVSQNMWYWVMLQMSGLSTPVLVFCYYKDGSVARFHLPELYYPSGYTVINETITISKTNTTTGTTGIPGLTLGSNDVRLTRVGAFTPDDDSVLRKQEIEAMISSTSQGNSYTGKFSTFDKFQDFKDITTTVANNAFTNENNLTSLNMPQVQTIGSRGFYNSPLTSLSLPEATSIGDNAFHYSHLTSLSLPKVTSIGERAFFDSPITSLSLPLATSIGDATFTDMINSSSTHVTMKAKFNTTSEKNRIFGYDNWTNMTFTWV